MYLPFTLVLKHVCVCVCDKNPQGWGRRTPTPLGGWPPPPSNRDLPHQAEKNPPKNHHIPKPDIQQSHTTKRNARRHPTLQPRQIWAKVATSACVCPMGIPRPPHGMWVETSQPHAPPPTQTHGTGPTHGHFQLNMYNGNLVAHA